jgi:hypothetical protein
LAGAAKKKKKAAKKKTTPKPPKGGKGPFNIYIPRKVQNLHFELEEKNNDPHRLVDGDEVLKPIAIGLADMKDCERWLREEGLKYNGERVVIMHRKLDKKLDLQVRTTLKFG